MKESKFRVWDIKGNRFLGDEYVYLKPNGQLYCRQLSFKDNSDEDYLKRNFTIQFFTGLKDRNGKKIFEGDIVSFQWGTLMYGNVGAYENGEVKRNKYGTWVINEGTPFDNDFRRKSNAEFEDETVVGNIFENPDLLKK